jgi:hypothetical protein
MAEKRWKVARSSRTLGKGIFVDEELVGVFQEEEIILMKTRFSPEDAEALAWGLVSIARSLRYEEKA